MNSSCSREFKPRVQGAHQSVEIVKNKRRCVEPETGKHGTPQCPIVRWIKPLMAFVAKHKPIDLAVEDAPDQVFANLVPEVSSELTVQVVSRATGGNLGDEFRGAVHVAILINVGLSS